MLPTLHAGWLHELLGGDIPDESLATCDHCAMVGDGGFLPDAKCCTYLPELLNFQVGGVLRDGDAVGRASMVARIDRKVAVTPLGVFRPRSYLLVYEDGGAALFGRSHGMRCPHYVEDGGRCGIWNHREATCATYFCKFVRGHVGRSFWRATHRLLASIERELAWMCVARLGFDPHALEQILNDRELARKRHVDPVEVDGGTPDGYRALWGTWAGREHDLYLRCAEQVDGMRWADVLATSSPTTAIAANVVRARYAELMSDAVPARLRTGAFRILRLDGERVRVVAYSEQDAVDLPRALLDALDSFDGRPIDEVVAELAKRDLELEPALVRKLVDLGVLVAADEPAPTA